MKPKYLQEMPIMGMHFRPVTREQRQSLKAGDALALKREPGNTHDNSAVAVYRQGVHIGYMPASSNGVFAGLMDYGLRFGAVVTDMYPGGVVMGVTLDPTCVVIQ